MDNIIDLESHTHTGLLISSKVRRTWIPLTIQLSVLSPENIFCNSCSTHSCLQENNGVMSSPQHPVKGGQAYICICQTYDSTTVSKGSGCEISWSWLAWSLLKRMMSHKVWDALDCLCQRKTTNVNSASVKCIQESASTVDTMFSITDMSYSLIKKNTEMPVYLFISVRVDELYESLRKFLFIQPLLRKTSHYSKEYLCVICRTMNVGPFVTYSQRL